MGGGELAPKIENGPLNSPKSTAPTILAEGGPLNSSTMANYRNPISDRML